MAQDFENDNDGAPIKTVLRAEPETGRVLLRSGVAAARLAARGAAGAAHAASEKATAAAGSTVQGAALVFGQVVGAGIFFLFGSIFVLLAAYAAIAPGHGEALAALVVAILALILAFFAFVLFKARRPAPAAAPSPLGFGAMTLLPMLFRRPRIQPARGLVVRPRRRLLRPRNLIIGLLLTAVASEALHRKQSS
jgi:hypothetical protein